MCRRCRVLPDLKNPYIGPMIYVADEASDTDRALTLREWNARRAKELAPRPEDTEVESLPVGHCPRCGTTRPLTRFDVCVRCTAECGWDPPCKACKHESSGGNEGELEHVATCAEGLRMASRRARRGPRLQ